MKDSTKFLLLTLLGTTCYIVYFAMMCFRGPSLADFIIITTNMFIWMVGSLLTTFLNLKRVEKKQTVEEIIDKLNGEDDNEI